VVAIVAILFLLKPKPKTEGKASVAASVPARKGFVRPADPEHTFYTAAEVSKHCTKDDLWIIVKGKVYDVTSYVDEHVGGEAIMKNPGKDNTEGFFGDQHPDKAHDMLIEFFVGHLKSKKDS